MILVEWARQSDLHWLAEHDRHLPALAIPGKIGAHEILIARLDAAPVGWLRYNLFWDTIPFMNMLFVLEPHRRRGVGTSLLTTWETQMRQASHTRVMTSSQANEQAQHFYRKHGYTDAGGLLLPGEPLEILFLKHLTAE